MACEFFAPLHAHFMNYLVKNATPQEILSMKRGGPMGLPLRFQLCLGTEITSRRIDPVAADKNGKGRKSKKTKWADGCTMYRMGPPYELECHTMAQVSISRELIASLLALPARQVWTDYDAEADVLYVSFRKPQRANDSIMEDEETIYHYRDDQLVGITILHASQRANASEGRGGGWG